MSVLTKDARQRARVLELRKQSIDAGTIAPNIIFTPDPRIDWKSKRRSRHADTPGQLPQSPAMRRMPRPVVWSSRATFQISNRYSTRWNPCRRLHSLHTISDQQGSQAVMEIDWIAQQGSTAAPVRAKLMIAAVTNFLLFPPAKWWLQICAGPKSLAGMA